MGAALCRRHGVDESGPLACPHVRLAVADGAVVPPLVAFAIDVDAAFVEATACEKCAKASGIATDVTVDWRDDTPQLAPVCGGCLRREAG